MRAWRSDAKTCVSSMADGDFYSSEKSHIMPKVGTGTVPLVCNVKKVTENLRIVYEPFPQCLMGPTFFEGLNLN